MATCFCGETLNSNNECPLGAFGGHQGNCFVCGKNAELDGLRCCSAECDVVVEEECFLGEDEIPF